MILRKHIKELVHEHFGSFGQGMLEQRIRCVSSSVVLSIGIFKERGNPRLIIQEHLTQCLLGAKEKINWLMKIQHEPFTLNDHYLADYAEKFRTYYRRVRKDSKTNNNNLGAERRDSDKSPDEEQTTEALSALAKLGYHGLKGEDLAKLLEQDDMEPALDIMATVRGYFQGTPSTQGVRKANATDNVP